MRAECMLIARCYVECHHLLALILGRLIECVRNLKPIAGHVKIHVKNIVPARLEIEALEEGFVVPDRMKGRELRRVQKTARSQSIQSEKVSDFIAAESHVRLTGTGSKRTIGPKDLPPRLTLPQTGSCRRIHNKACLLTKLGRRRTCYDFHSLQRVHRNLSREDFTLLIVDRLPINLERCAGVVT